jgi:prevent-host-death family protein
MKTIGATKFKEQCLSLLEKVNKDGVVITKHGKPVAKLIPMEIESSQLIGTMKGKIKVKGNIISTGLKWNAQS